MKLVDLKSIVSESIRKGEDVMGGVNPAKNIVNRVNSFALERKTLLDFVFEVFRVNYSNMIANMFHRKMCELLKDKEGQTFFNKDGSVNHKFYDAVESIKNSCKAKKVNFPYQTNIDIYSNLSSLGWTIQVRFCHPSKTTMYRQVEVYVGAVNSLTGDIVCVKDFVKREENYNVAKLSKLKEKYMKLRKSMEDVKEQLKEFTIS